MDSRYTQSHQNCRISKPAADYIADSILEIGCKAIYQQLKGLIMVLVHGTWYIHTLS